MKAIAAAITLLLAAVAPARGDGLGDESEEEDTGWVDVYEAIQLCQQKPTGRQCSADRAEDPEDQFISSRVLVLSQLLPQAAPAAVASCAATAPTPTACTASAAPASRADLSACANALLDGRSSIVGGAIALGPNDAKLVASSARSQDLGVLSLETNERVAQLVMAAAATASEVAADADRRARVTAACSELASWLRAPDHAPPAPGLTCGLRAAAGYGAKPLLARWPGCTCGAFGAMVGATCVEGSAERPFPAYPVDARLPGMLERAITLANRRLDKLHLGIRGVQLIGCHVPRMERGPTAQHLDASLAPKLGLDIVSSHSAGSACDIGMVWTEWAPISMEMAYLGSLSPARLFRDEAELRKTNVGYARELGGEGAFFRRREADIAKRIEPIDLRFPPGSGSESGAVLASYSNLVGIALRNALVDAGFIVYSPLTNRAHLTHLHFAIPADATLAAKLSAPTTTPNAREKLLRPLLVRAGSP